MTGQVLETKSFAYNAYQKWIIPLYAVLILAVFYFAMNNDGTLALACLAAIVFLSRKLYLYIRNPEKGESNAMPISFSDTEMLFGGDVFLVNNMEVIAVFLEGFDGFTYRTMEGMARQGGTRDTCDGNGNKVSFRTNDGTVHDFTFYLAGFSDFSLMRKLLVVWEQAGVNVALKQTHADEVILNEMAYFSRR